jgi:hypothetical protein
MRHHLIVANQTLGESQLRDEVRQRLQAGPCTFFVVVPDTHADDLAAGWAGLSALGGIPGVEVPPSETAPGQWGHRDDARLRLEAALAMLRAAGAEADGVVGDPDPVAAVESVLATRPVDEIIVSTLPDRLSRWLRLDLPNRLRQKVDVPVTVVTARR